MNERSSSGSGGKILEGTLIGAVLGVAAGILLAPESGKKMRKDITKLSGNFYHYIAPRIKKLERMGEAEYHAFVAEGIKKYAKAKRLSLAEEKVLAKEARRSWGHIKKHLP